MDEKKKKKSARAVTVMDEPFVSKAFENYFTASDPYFAREVRKRIVKSTAIEQGCVFERFMMKVSVRHSTHNLYRSGRISPLSLICAQHSLAMLRLLAERILDSRKVRPTQ